MENNLLITFIVLNAINVIIQTIKSLCTIKGSKLTAALVNAFAYGFYTIVVIYMVCELPLYQKVIIVGSCNFIGVYIVKYVEEKTRKDKLWKIEVTIPAKWTEVVKFDLKAIPHSYIKISPKYTLFNFYCATQSESQMVKDIVNQYQAKYFASEGRTL